MIQCGEATEALLFVPNVLISASHARSSDNEHNPNQENETIQLELQLPSLHTSFLKNSKRGRRSNKDPRSKRYKKRKSIYGREQRKRGDTKQLQLWRMSKAKIKINKQNMKLKEVVLHLQNTKKINKVKWREMKQQIEYEFVHIEDIERDIQNIDDMIDEEWTNDEGMQKYRCSDIEQTQITLQVLECSLISNMTDSNISKHLRNQRIINNMFDDNNQLCPIWSPSTIKRFMRYKLPVIYSLVVSLFLIVYFSNECAIVWDDTTRNNAKMMAVHLQRKWEPVNSSNDTLQHIKPDPNTSDVASLCIGYSYQYNAANDGCLHAITQNINTLNEYIDLWKADEQLLRNCFTGTEFVYDHIQTRIIIGQSDRAEVNNTIYRSLQSLCPNLETDGLLFSCVRHDLNNSWLMVVNHHKQTNHINELENIPHPHSIGTYMARLWKETSAWIHNKSKYFQHYVTQDVHQEKVMVNSWLSQLVYSKGMRALNMMVNLVFLPLLEPFFARMIQYKWRSSSILTCSASTQIQALQNRIIKSETIQGGFLYSYLYLPLCLSSKQFSLKHTRDECFDLMSVAKNCSQDKCTLVHFLFFSRFIYHERKSTNENILLSNLYKIYIVFLCDFGDTITVEICQHFWENIQIYSRENTHIISLQNYVWYYIFISQLQFVDLLQIFNETQIDLDIIYAYLFRECAWSTKIMLAHPGTEHLRNNNDRIERSHSLSSYFLKLSGIKLSAQMLNNKVCAKDILLTEFLMSLLRSDNRYHLQLLKHILDYARNINVAHFARVQLAEQEKATKLKEDYLQKYMKKKGRKKKGKKKKGKKKKKSNKTNKDKKTKSGQQNCKNTSNTNSRKKISRKRKANVLETNADSVFECNLDAVDTFHMQLRLRKKSRHSND